MDVVANTGSNLQEQRLLAGLTVVASRTSARVLDDGFPVAGAALGSGGRTVHTNAAGLAGLGGFRRHALVMVSAACYAPTAFRRA